MVAIHVQYLSCRKFCSESISERILKIDQVFAKLYRHE